MMEDIAAIELEWKARLEKAEDKALAMELLRDIAAEDIQAIIKEKDAHMRLHIQALAQRDALAAAAREFVRKVEAGEARSVRSYADFKAALALMESK